MNVKFNKALQIFNSYRLFRINMDTIKGTLAVRLHVLDPTNKRRENRNVRTTASLKLWYLCRFYNIHRKYKC